jgi:hypothetical protein
MGIFRKMTIISTGGLAPIKANSKKERTAKAAEKQLKLQKQALKLDQERARREAETQRRLIAQEGQQAAREGERASAEAEIRSFLVADELTKLVALKEQGHLSDAEFAAHKARLLGSRQLDTAPPVQGGQKISEPGAGQPGGSEREQSEEG